MMRIFDYSKTWLVSQAVVFAAILALALLHVLQINIIKLEPLLALALCSAALIASHTLLSAKGKIIIALSLFLIGMLPIFDATLGLASLAGVAYLLEDEENGLYLFSALLLCLVETLPSLGGQISSTKFGSAIYSLTQLLLLYLISLRSVRPERILAIVLLTLSPHFQAAASFELMLPLLFIISFISSVKYGVNRALLAFGLTLAICEHSLGLMLISIGFALAYCILLRNKLKSQFDFILPLFVVLALFQETPLYAAAILGILIVKIAISSGIKVCLSKSHL